MKTTDTQWINLWRKCRNEHAIRAALHAAASEHLGQPLDTLALRNLRRAARAENRLMEATTRWLDEREETGAEANERLADELELDHEWHEEQRVDEAVEEGQR